jgi:hypothetical protein
MPRRTTETVGASRLHRFFFHYNKAHGCMTVHFKGQCLLVEDVSCMVPCESKWSERQPRLVMQGFAARVTTNKDCGTLEAVIE